MTIYNIIIILVLNNIIKVVCFDLINNNNYNSNDNHISTLLESRAPVLSTNYSTSSEHTKQNSNGAFLNEINNKNTILYEPKNKNNASKFTNNEIENLENSFNKNPSTSGAFSKFEDKQKNAPLKKTINYRNELTQNVPSPSTEKIQFLQKNSEKNNDSITSKKKTNSKYLQNLQETGRLAYLTIRDKYIDFDYNMTSLQYTSVLVMVVCVIVFVMYPLMNVGLQYAFDRSDNGGNTFYDMIFHLPHEESSYVSYRKRYASETF